MVATRLGLKHALAAAAVAPLLVALGCGSDRPPPAGETSFAPPAAGTSGGGFGEAGAAPPGCGTKDDGSFCDCIDVPLFGEPPNIYFVLDRSGSMSEGGKWDQVRVTVARILRSLGPRASFGATIFPGGTTANGSACGPGVEVMSVMPGDPPSSGVDGPTTRTLLDATRVVPIGGPPTATTLQAVLPRVKALPGKTFVILATDGGPNCNANASCSHTTCMPNIENAPGCPSVGPINCCNPPEGFRENCLDAAPTISAVAALTSAGVPTFVIGIPGSAPYGALLDDLAVAGGTAQATSPKYYRVDTTSSDQLLATLKKVAAKIVATCEFKLASAPADANAVNVYLDDVVLPREPVDGWKLEGDTVTLLGKACERVLAGDVLDVRIIAGCPTIEPR